MLARSPRGLFERFQRKSVPSRPGIYVFDRQDGSEKSRIHLRIDPDGTGTLLVNAARIYQLNPSAALMAKLYLQEKPELEAVSLISQVFQIPAVQAKTDYAACIQTIETLIQPDDVCPICDLELESTAPFSSRPTAPYRMDLALTYRCNNNCAHCYNARPRNYPELSTADWKRILDRCWEIGIPHIIFTGGEPTLKDDLAELIAHAQSLGQITGINTNGRRLSDAGYVEKLVSAGLDHVQITLESSDPTIHDRLVCHSGAWLETTAGIQNVVASRLYMMTNTTLLEENARTLEETLALLKKLGVATVGLNALIYSGRGKTVGTGLPESELPRLLDSARELTSKNDQRLIWYTPTQYCHFDPLALQLGVKGCTAALYNMCIEPDGSVIPCQSYYEPLGRLLEENWSTIWNHPLSVSLRERKNVSSVCNDCSLLLECGGGCPLHQLESQPQPILAEFA
jgi:radical SAM protein with 4Fe4S-binding SPASM domain